MSATDQYPDFTGLTFEKVWAMFQESHKESQKLSEQMKETDKALTRLEKQVVETSKEVAKTSKEVDKTTRIVAETTKAVAQTNKQFGHLGNRFGEVIEHLIIPAAIPRFNALGFHFDDAAQNHKVIDSETGDVLAELDILMENGDSMVVVEIKAKPSLADVEEHIERLQIFRAHKNRKKMKDARKIYGAIASAVCTKDVHKAAIKAGFFVLLQSGDTVKIDVPKGFVPTAF
jgi:uncharacterized coiled-coil protein SlyX/Holliday junction resolvase-like predicted endonuclease